jgi:hypothetical protein
VNQDHLAAPSDGEREAKLQAAPLSAYSPEDQAFYRFWYGHMLNDLMQPPLANVDHATARYIWQAASAARSAEIQQLREALKNVCALAQTEIENITDAEQAVIDRARAALKEPQ